MKRSVIFSKSTAGQLIYNRRFVRVPVRARRFTIFTKKKTSRRSLIRHVESVGPARLPLGLARQLSGKSNLVRILRGESDGELLFRSFCANLLARSPWAPLENN
jgi:hypothetical protein